MSPGLDRRHSLGGGRLTLVFVIVVVGAVAVARGLAAPDDGSGDGPGRLVGTIAPEVVVDAFDGQTWRLSRSLGERPVVLNLWASYCPPCVEEIPELSRFSTENPDVLVVGAAVRDEPEAARALVEELQPAYRIGMDATGRLRDALPTVGLPATFVIDESGVITHQFERPVTAEDLEHAIGAG